MRTNEEDRLSEWLRQHTPEPPRMIRVEDVQARMAPARAVSRWAPILAAACVVALVVTLVLVTDRMHSEGPADHRTPTGGPARIHTPVAGAPWGGELVHAGAVDDDTLTTTGGALYANQFYSGQPLLRLDPVSGRVLATAPAPDGVVIDGPVMAGGALWSVTIPLGSTRAMLYSYDPTTLRVRTHRSLILPGLSGQNTLLTLTAPADGSALYVGGGTSIGTVDLRTGAIATPVDSTGPVQAVSISPDGSALYVGLAGGIVIVMNPATGTVTRTQAPQVNTVDALQATTAGVLIAADTGPGSRVVFAPTDRPGVLVTVRAASGPVAPKPRLAGGVAWIAGTGRIVCADPTTGAVRASAAIPARVRISGVTDLDGHVFAAYQALGTVTQPSGVIELHPPARCGLK